MSGPTEGTVFTIRPMVAGDVPAVCRLIEQLAGEPMSHADLCARFAATC